jgi:hypothetical protein
MKILIMTVLLLLGWMCGTALSYTLAEYNEIKDHTVFKMYITGYGHGLLGASVYAEVEGQPAIFCPPPKLKLTGAIYLSILADELNQPHAIRFISKHEADKHAPFSKIEMFLLDGLVRVFPCPAQVSKEGSTQ